MTSQKTVAVGFSFRAVGHAQVLPIITTEERGVMVLISETHGLSPLTVGYSDGGYAVSFISYMFGRLFVEKICVYVC